MLWLFSTLLVCEYILLIEFLGLDPALPLFSVNQPLERISTDSAHYVEIIHTNGGNLAFLSPLGKFFHIIITKLILSRFYAQAILRLR